MYSSAGFIDYKYFCRLRVRLRTLWQDQSRCGKFRCLNYVKYISLFFLGNTLTQNCYAISVAFSKIYVLTARPLPRQEKSKNFFRYVLVKKRERDFFDRQIFPRCRPYHINLGQ